MRTTITLDPETEVLVQRMMAERGLTFKQAVNLAIRNGLRPRAPGVSFSTPTFPMGAHPNINFDGALRLAGELEDEEMARKIAARR